VDSVRFARMRVQGKRAVEAILAENWVAAEEGLRAFIDGLGVRPYFPASTPEKEALLREREEESRSKSRKDESEARRRARADDSQGVRGTDLSEARGMSDILNETQSRVLDDSTSARRVEQVEDPKPRTREDLRRLAGVGSDVPTDDVVAKQLVAEDRDLFAIMGSSAWVANWLLDEVVSSITSSSDSAGAGSNKAVRETLMRTNVEEAFPLSFGVLFSTLAYAQYAQGKRTQADIHYLRAISHLRSVSSAESSQYFLANTLLNHSALLYQRWLLAEAEAEAREASQIISQLYGPRHEMAAAALNNLAGYLFALKRYDEARALAVRVLEVLTDRAGAHSEYAQSALLNAVASMKELGASDEEVAEFRTKWRELGTPDPFYRLGIDPSSKEASSLDLGPPDSEVERLVEKFQAYVEAKPLDPAGLFKDRKFARLEIQSFVESLTDSELQGISPDVVYSMFDEIVAASTPSPIDSESELDALLADRLLLEADEQERENPGALTAIEDEEILAMHAAPVGLKSAVLAAEE
jgi:tetratricopeptide (TPR) repeat protein